MGSVICAQSSNKTLDERRIREEYDYHILFRGVSRYWSEMLVYWEDRYYMRGNGEYEILKYEEVQIGGEEPVWDFYIKLSGGRDEEDDLNIVYWGFISQFKNVVTTSTTDASMYVSPLFYKDAEYRFSTLFFWIVEELTKHKPSVSTIFGIDVPYENKPLFGIFWNYLYDSGDVVFIATIIILIIVAFIIMIILLSVRQNHHKFNYGIFMTYGADSKKLFHLAVWETLLVIGITLIPAYIMAAFINMLLHFSSSIGYIIKLDGIIITFILTVMITLAAQFITVKKMAKQQIITLLYAENNSNMVSSPRMSFEFYGLKFPLKYVAYSFWRFRKYYIPLVITAAGYCAIFVCGIYFTFMYTNALNSSVEPQFTITIPATDWYDYNYLVKEKLFEINGVTDVVSEISSIASEVVSHIVVDRKLVMKGNGFTNVVNDENSMATNDFTYIAADKNIADRLKNKFGEEAIEFINDENSVTVSFTKNEIRQLDIKIGDKIKIADFIEAKGGIDLADDNTKILEQQLLQYDFNYEIFTVSSVIEEERTDSAMRIYINYNKYMEIAGDTRAELFLSFVAFNHEQIREAYFPVGEYYEEYVEYYLYTENNQEIAAVTDVTYHTTDEYELYGLEKKPYTGDINAPLLYENNIILSRCINGNNALSVTVGDKINIAVINTIANYPDSSLTGLDRLENQIYNNEYEFMSFTVGCIIDDPDSKTLDIYFSPDSYKEITGNSQQYENISVYTDTGKTDVNSIFNDIRQWGYFFGNSSIKNHNTSFKAEMEKNYNYTGYMIMISAALVIISIPGIIYTQLLFYYKRRGEIKLLRVYGAVDFSIKKLFYYDFIIYSLLTITVYPVFIIIGIINIFNAARGMGTMLASFEFPLVTFILGIVILIAEGIISILLPYLISEKNNDYKL